MLRCICRSISAGQSNPFEGWGFDRGYLTQARPDSHSLVFCEVAVIRHVVTK